MDANPTSRARPDTTEGGFWIAILLHLVGLPSLALLLRLLVALLGLPTGPESFFSNDFLACLIMVAGLSGWTQLLYMLPAAAVLHGRGERAARNGLLATTGVLFLITSACAGPPVLRWWAGSL